MIFSIDLRERVMIAVDNGMEIDEAVKIFKLSRRTIYYWKTLRKTTNSLEPKSGYQKGHSHKITDLNQFKIFAKKHQHCTLIQMSIEWKKLTNINVSGSLIFKALKKIGYTSKKKRLIMSRQIKKNVNNI